MSPQFVLSREKFLYSVSGLELVALYMEISVFDGQLFWYWKLSGLLLQSDCAPSRIDP